MLILSYLNLADWHAATLFHPLRVDHEIFNNLVCMNAVFCVICIMCHLLFCFYICSWFLRLIDLLDLHLKTSKRQNINKKRSVKQYVGLVIILKSWSSLRFSDFIIISSLFIGKLIVAKRSHHGWLHIDDVIIVAKSDFCTPENFSLVATLQEIIANE